MCNQIEDALAATAHVEALMALRITGTTPVEEDQ